MSEDHLVDEFRQTPGIGPLSASENGVHIERRQARREPLKTLDDARANVQAIAKRRIDEDLQVKRWRFAKKVIYLFVLVVAFLFYYFIDKLNEALSLLGVGF